MTGAPTDLRSGPGSITWLLLRTCEGDRAARSELLEALHARLHELAEQRMRDQPAGHTLQPTALLNEAFLKIFREAAPGFRDRQHFLATVSRAMRCILVDHARAKATRKRAPSGVAVALNFLVDSYQRRAVDLLALDEALDRLFSLDPDMVRIVELRFFGGLGVEETAQVIGQSVRTVEREWSAARSWLRRALS